MKTPGRIGASLLATLLALASGCGSSGSTSATEVSESSRSVPSASAGSSPAASGASASVAIATTDSTSGTSPSGFTVASTFTDSDALVAALTAIGVACSGKLAPLESSEVPNAGYVCRDSDPSSFDAMVYQSAEDRNTTRDWVSNVEYLGTVQGDMWDVHCWVPTSCEPLEVTFGSVFIPSNGLRTSQPSPSTSVSATTTTTPSTSGTSASPATSDSDDQLCVIRSVEDMFAPCAPAPEPKGVKHSDPGTYQELPDDQPNILRPRVSTRFTWTTKATRWPTQSLCVGHRTGRHRWGHQKPPHARGMNPPGESGDSMLIETMLPH